MENIFLNNKWTSFPVHLVGIKGAGMTALAEVLQSFGADITGSDVPEQFYTDEILKKCNISYFETFDAENIRAQTQLLIYSAAYSLNEHPELKEARKRGLPVYSYPQALGMLSECFISAGIAGVHGKTTCAALAGVLAKELKLKATTLVGSAVKNFDGHAVYSAGKKYLIAETCEYKRHFLHFHPDMILLTSVEEDHQDYYKDFSAIQDAFIEYIVRLPQRGLVIYCSDDAGACDTVAKAVRIRQDVKAIPYGFNADGPYALRRVSAASGENCFSLAAVDEVFSLKLPGDYLIQNAAGAIALLEQLCASENKAMPWNSIKKALASFQGTKRRSELIDDVNGIIIMDDFAHHPTAIKKALQGLKNFYPGRRIIVDFMSHTYSRTEALLDDFAAAFNDADLLFLHKIYASAREKAGSINGETLFHAVKAQHSSVWYFQEPMDAFPELCRILSDGDLFLTMGAGNNNQLAYSIARYLRSEDT